MSDLAIACLLEEVAATLEADPQKVAVAIAEIKDIVRRIEADLPTPEDFDDFNDLQ